MKKLLLCVLVCLPAGIYCMENNDNDDELNKLKMLSAAALLKKCPEQKGGVWSMPIKKLAQFTYPFEQNNQKTGMSESYLTFIREPIFSINLPYFDDELTKADRILNESLRIPYAFLRNHKTDQEKVANNN